MHFLTGDVIDLSYLYLSMKSCQRCTNDVNGSKLPDFNSIILIKSRIWIISKHNLINDIFFNKDPNNHFQVVIFEAGGEMFLTLLEKGRSMVTYAILTLINMGLPTG